MREHVCARCGAYLLLFPAENIAAIEPVLGQVRFSMWHRRPSVGAGARTRGPRTPAGPRPRGEPVLDLRLLLAVPSPAPASEGVILRWRSTDDLRRLSLLVDAVEAIVNCYADDLIEVPILPRRLRPLCEQVMHDPSGRLRLRVKPDVKLPFQRTVDRRRYVRSLLRAEAAA